MLFSIRLDTNGYFDDTGHLLLVPSLRLFERGFIFVWLAWYAHCGWKRMLPDDDETGE